MVSFKQQALDWVGYDPAVVAAASTSDSLQSSTEDLPARTRGFLKSLFPFTAWIGSYNLTWAISDLIAGLTVGMVVGK